MTRLFPAFCLFSLFCGCAGLFRNPDLAPGASVAYMPYHRLSLPEISNEEERIYRQQGDTGVARIPEHDFYWMQGNLLCLAASFARPDSTCDPLRFVSFTKDITRKEQMYTPEFSPDSLLDPLKSLGLALYALDNCPQELMRALLINNQPVLVFGTLLYKKRLTRKTEGPDMDAQRSKILRKITTFDIVYGYSRMTGPSQRLPGEGGDEYLFELRTRRNFKARVGQGLINHALTPYGGMPIGSNWLVERVYLVFPQEKDFDAFWAGVGETAKKLDYPAPLPMPVRLF